MNPPKLCLVTGASRGIGRQIALGLAEQGHKVISISRSAIDPSTLLALQKDLVVSLTGDVCDFSFIENLEKQVASEHGVVEIIIY